MKNLFKNLMLVAVAAMAFTACTETNDEVNASVEKRVFKFVAGFDEETRSGFDGKNDAGTGYKSAWDGNETLKVCANGAFASAQEVTLKDAEGHFEVELTGNPALIDVFSPASAWNSENYPTVPAVQTPRANSVDPAAHILKAQGASVESGIVTMQHKVAYGKMTVNTPSGFEISKVELSLVGLPYGWTEDQTYSYTINATYVENNTFWFTTEALNHVKEFTVTAYNADGDKYAKTVTGLDEGKLRFVVGQVSSFSVSDLEEYVAFTRAYVADDAYYPSDYVIWFEGPAGTLKTNPCQITTDDWALIPGTYEVRTSGQCFYKGAWTALNGQSSESGTITVSVVDGMYHFDFNIIHTNGTVFTESYTGLVEGLNIPDMRTQLEIPNVTATVSGKTITLRWDPVEHADGYLVKMFSPYDEYFEEIVTTNEYVYEAQKSNTVYSFNVYSYASDENPTYKTSTNWYYLTATTEDTDPKIVLSKETISFTADGGNVAVDVTLKNIDGDFTYTVDVDWLTVTRPDSGASLAVSAPAYDNESEDRNATITITAGDLTKNIAVTQRKKIDGTYGTEANPYVFDSQEFLPGPDLSLKCSANGAHLYFWLNGPIYQNVGKDWISLVGVGSWYSSGSYYEYDGNYYTATDLAAKSQSITTKLSDDEYQTLFKVDVGDYGPIYYTVITAALK